MKTTFIKSSLVLALLSALSPTGVAAVNSGSIHTATTIEEDVILIGDKKLTFTDGSSANFGVWTFDTPVNLTGNIVEINVVGEGSRNAYAASTGAGGSLTLGKTGSTVTINTKSEAGVIGLWASGAKNQNGGLLQVDGDTLTINAESTATEDGWVYGLYTQNTTVGATTQKSTVIINSKNTVINAKSSTDGAAAGIVAMSEGMLEINGNLEVHADKAIVTRGDAVITINKNKTNTVKLYGDIDFDYDGQTSGTKVDSQLTINLTGAESEWVGNTQINWGQGKNSDGTPKPIDPSKLEVNQFNLSLAKGASWTPTVVNESENVSENGLANGTKYTNLNNLNLEGGIVNIANKDIKVTVDSMVGSGTVNLAVSGEDAGKFNVIAADDKASLDVKLKTEDLKNDLTSDDINAEQAKALLKNVGSNEGGATIVETKTEVKEGLVNNGFGVNSKGETTTNSANTLMQSSLEMASAAPLALNRIMMNDVRKRLGDIRTSNGTHGAWARYDGGKLSGEGGLENDFHTIQVGIDTVPTADAPRMGVAFSYTDSDAEYARGSADMKAYSLAMYSTWMGDNGQFFDLIGRMGTADTDMIVDGQHKGSMDNVALSMSGEFGWRFDVTDSIYVEPQVEATYTYVNEDSLTLSTANYDVDAVHSLLGRIGFAAGMKCPSDYGNVYVRASAVHEFLGDSKITGVNAGNTNVYEIDGKDTWFEYGIGANFNITKSTYMWADVERTTGGALDEDWRATVGVRYAW